MSKPSLVGRIGIDLFYKQYQFLKIWWQGAILVFITWMILLGFQAYLLKKLSILKSRIVLFSSILIAIIGFYFTWDDFRQTTTHRWLKERFHIGAYLFWLGWILISIFLLLQNKHKATEHEKKRGDSLIPDQGTGT
jgi:hypothetical protein